ncbi:hypothetical protein GGX14DRAFT_397685 [Mycena pura]|uniref:Uncharacterized protein n=1 Tax=Mycena pura TaxID=153505 RepID=A0AAD6VFE6_9AGAR|nr:hypothetical protein GGX14DRAFT_397685 [Mycena pura]
MCMSSDAPAHNTNACEAHRSALGIKFSLQIELYLEGISGQFKPAFPTQPTPSCGARGALGANVHVGGLMVQPAESKIAKLEPFFTESSAMNVICIDMIGKAQAAVAKTLAAKPQSSPIFDPFGQRLEAGNATLGARAVSAGDCVRGGRCARGGHRAGEPLWSLWTNDIDLIWRSLSSESAQARIVRLNFTVSNQIAMQKPQLFGLEVDAYRDGKITCSTLIFTAMVQGI